MHKKIMDLKCVRCCFRECGVNCGGGGVELMKWGEGLVDGLDYTVVDEKVWEIPKLRGGWERVILFLTKGRGPLFCLSSSMYVLYI